MKRNKIATALLLTLLCVILLASCYGNQSCSDGLTNKSNTFRYAVIVQDGERVLYSIDKWVDSESDVVGIKYKTSTGEDQILWVSYINANLYGVMPERWEYDFTYTEMCAKQ